MNLELKSLIYIIIEVENAPPIRHTFPRQSLSNGRLVRIEARTIVPCLRQLGANMRLRAIRKRLLAIALLRQNSLRCALLMILELHIWWKNLFAA